jgi:dTDP-glucose 4,6-dehydratase
MTLVTGAAGFIGSHAVKALGGDCIALVRTGKVGDMRRIPETKRVVWHDLRSPIGDATAKQLEGVTDIIHFAAETHVDRSIHEPEPFIVSNIMGTMHLLEYARKVRLPGRFVLFSTDEVFGPAPLGTAFAETDTIKCGNPYAAGKAGAEQCVYAWANTYGIDASIVRGMNVYGPMQDTEKFIPKVIGKVLRGETVEIHADPTLMKSGSRHWLYVLEAARAALYVLKHGKTRTAYHAVGPVEMDNLSLAKLLAQICGRELKYRMVDWHSSRPGHDLRYALADNNLKALGWEPRTDFEMTMTETVQWYIAHPEWLRG